MTSSLIPSRALIGGLVIAGLVLTVLACTPATPKTLEMAAALGALGLGALLGVDGLVSVTHWQRAPLRLRRELPQAFALGRQVTLELTLENPGARRQRGQLFDMTDASMTATGMPLPFDLRAGQMVVLRSDLTPTQRGLRHFEAAQLRLRSRLGLLDLRVRVGGRDSRRVFPNFANQAAFAWLTGERRLSAMGIKAVRRRGAGTDFDQLTDYRAGDPIRHIDWKATLTHRRPIARKFQDDRDQRVMFLLDCGRRMRADDTQYGIGATHFDQALNALMLLAFVALKSGDAVGAMTFGTPEGAAKRYAPRKGVGSLNALMAELGDVEPTPSFSDYPRCAAELISRLPKRSLVILITNCRDEDAPELAAALALLRSRHLVVLANLREQIVARIAGQPLHGAAAALEAAAALDYAQTRGAMLRRFALAGALTVDCEPPRLGVELVNRYTALKRAGAL